MPMTFDEAFAQYKAVMRDCLAGTDQKTMARRYAPWFTREVKLDLARKILSQQPDDALLELVLNKGAHVGAKNSFETSIEQLSSSVERARQTLMRKNLDAELDQAFAEFQSKRKK